MRHTLLVILVLLLAAVPMKAQSQVDTRIAVNTAVDDRTFVVIIANEQYKHEEQVPFAQNDGETFKLYCQKTLGIPESNINYVPNATLGEMTRAIYWWLNNMLSAEDGAARAIIYYSGHGMPDEKGTEAYLLPVDGFSQSTESALSTRMLYQKLGEMPTAEVMVFLDACFSGARRDGKMMASSRGVAIKTKPSLVAANTVVFSAAQGDETAYPFKSGHHGLFTYYLLEKLQEKGGYVTLGELSDYVIQKVKRQAVRENNGKPQTPTVVASQQNAGWRQWQLASVAAKNYEQRQPLLPTIPNEQQPVAQPQPVQPVVQSQPVQPVVQSQPVQPQPDNRQFNPTKADPVLADLVTQGKKAMRAMNYQKAKECFSKAADKGYTEAYYQLGLLYSNSNYEGYDKEKATGYFLKAANRYHVEAMYQAGMILMGSDNAAAKTWFEKAASKGHARASKQLSGMK